VEIIHLVALADQDLWHRDLVCPVHPDPVHPDRDNALEIILLELLVDLDRQDLLVHQVHRADQCQGHVLVLFVQVLLHVHNALTNVLVKVVRVQVKVHQVLDHKVLVHIDHNQVAHLVPEVLVDQVAQDNVLAQAAHLEKVAERKRVTRARKRSAKRSTTWKRPQLVAQLFLEEMEVLQSDFDAAHHLQTLLKKLAQIPQP
jgi:hypothetical protein